MPSPQMTAARYRIAWIVERVDYNVASFRYRSLIPAYELSAIGTQSIFTTIDAVSVADADFFIFVKVFGPKHLDFAAALHRAGRPYILDLCDNIFWADYAPKRAIGGRDNFLQMAVQASAIVVTCNALAKVACEYLPEDQVPVVIPDAAFSLQDHLDISAWFDAMRVGRGWSGNKFLTSSDVGQFAKRPWRSLISRSLRYLVAPSEAIAATKRLLLKRAISSATASTPTQVQTPQPGLAQRQRRRKLIWFGKHGTTYSKAGMQSLTAIIPHLIKINSLVPIELVIISNNRAKFHDRLLRLPFPTRYRAWSNETVFKELRGSDVFLMPNETDGFSACKSANRAVMSLEMGVPVIATWLDSLEPLADAIVIDDWQRGLENYLLHDGERGKALAQASKVIDAVYARKVVAERWLDLARISQERRQAMPPFAPIIAAGTGTETVAGTGPLRAQVG